MELVDHSETLDGDGEPDSSDEDHMDATAGPVTKRGRIQWITSRVLAALDNAKVSDGMAVHIIIAVAEALGHRVDELIINRETIRQLRKENRRNESEIIQANFVDNVILKS